MKDFGDATLNELRLFVGGLNRFRMDILDQDTADSDLMDGINGLLNDVLTEMDHRRRVEQLSSRTVLYKNAVAYKDADRWG